MVYNGPSKGCRACRKRRVKCDQGKPACNNCSRRKVECPGYESTFDYRHRNETNSTILRAQQKGDGTRRKPTPPNAQGVEIIQDFDFELMSDSASTPASQELVAVCAQSGSPDYNAFGVPLLLKSMLDPDPEPLVIDWYFKNYPMKCVDPQAIHGFVPLLKPLYLSAPNDSPLKPAVAAVASNLLMLFCHQGCDTNLARKFYAQAVTRMKDIITDPVRSKQDDMIMTTLALNFYEVVNLRWSPDPTSADNHKDGTVALFKHRGAYNHQNDVTRQLTACLRTAICNWGLEKGTPISPEILHWLLEQSVPTNKASELDFATLKLINFQNHFKKFYKADKRDFEPSAMAALIDEGLQVDEAFTNWADSCAAHWYPLNAYAEDVLPSIRSAGFYGNKCLVYWDVSISDLWITYRLRRLTLLHMVCQLCLDSMNRQFVDTMLEIEGTMQRMLDEICETIPFILGDCVDVMRHSQLYDINYPFASNGVCTFPNPDHDHPRAAASSGGWMASAALVGMAKLAVKEGVLEPFNMRSGQFKWILGQLDRMQKVYLLSQPAARSSWKQFKDF